MPSAPFQNAIMDHSVTPWLFVNWKTSFSPCWCHCKLIMATVRYLGTAITTSDLGVMSLSGGSLAFILCDLRFVTFFFSCKSSIGGQCIKWNMKHNLYLAIQFLILYTVTSSDQNPATISFPSSNQQHVVFSFVVLISRENRKWLNFFFPCLALPSLPFIFSWAAIIFSGTQNATLFVAQGCL